MREYSVSRCVCRKCNHAWIEPLEIDRVGDPDGGRKVGEWIVTETECPECGSEDVEVDGYTKWVSV